MLSLPTDVLLKPLGVLLKPYFDEKLRAFRYERNFEYASNLLKKKDVSKARNGLDILAELVRNYPHRTQEVIDSISCFLRERWRKNRAHEEEWDSVLSDGLRILAGFSKMDQNQHPYYVEITQIMVRNVELKGIFDNFVLWGTEFINVNMTRSSFRNTDLGGCQFTHKTSVEWSDFSGAMMDCTLENVCTTFNGAMMRGSTFNDAKIYNCKMISCFGLDTKDLKKASLIGRLEVVFEQQQEE